jgi:hypothetical protein
MAKERGKKLILDGKAADSRHEKLTIVDCEAGRQGDVAPS